MFSAVNWHLRQSRTNMSSLCHYLVYKAWNTFCFSKHHFKVKQLYLLIGFFYIHIHVHDKVFWHILFHHLPYLILYRNLWYNKLIFMHVQLPYQITLVIQLFLQLMGVVECRRHLWLSSLAVWSHKIREYQTILCLQNPCNQPAIQKRMSSMLKKLSNRLTVLPSIKLYKRLWFSC